MNVRRNYHKRVGSVCSSLDGAVGEMGGGDSLSGGHFDLAKIIREEMSHEGTSQLEPQTMSV